MPNILLEKSGEIAPRRMKRWSQGEGEGGMIWENGTETCIISYKKWNRQSRFDAGYRIVGAGALG